jgi:predicted dehydrogenase
MEGQEHRKVSIVIVGCGNRGAGYAQYHHIRPSLCEVVGVAEPREITRKHMQELYSLEPSNVFADWRDMLSRGRIADAAVIATQDRDHSEPAIALANLGYNILLEKPMATSMEECKGIAKAAKDNKIIFTVGHVLRYTAYSRKLKEILDSGIIGDIVSVQHLEPVGWYHFAHSYVRGNWRNSDQSSFILMAKSCHDIDWLMWIIGKKCTKVSSFGSLKHFNSASKPVGAGSRCLDCAVEATCPYSAKALYLTGPRGVVSGNRGWPVNVLSETVSEDSIREALRNGPYGRCVYDCDNNVMDNQVVNLQFDDGTTASFTMVAFSEEICTRKTRIFGTKGEVTGDGETEIKVFTFANRKKLVYHPDPYEKNGMHGHAGGDFELMKSFIRAVALNDPTLVSSPQETLESHLVVFEAEKSRLQNSVANLDW